MIEKNFKIIFLLALVWAFVSCSNDGFLDKEQNNVTEFSKESIFYSKDSEIMSVDDYATEHIRITDRIFEILAKYYLDSQSFVLSSEQINSQTTKDQLFQYMANASINFDDRNEIINLLEQDMNFYENLLSVNTEYSSMEQNERQILLKKTITSNYDKLYSASNMQTTFGLTCKQKWDIAISRCKRNHAIESGLSAAAAVFTGGVGGLIGFAGATVHWTFCLKDARDDYYICQYG